MRRSRDWPRPSVSALCGTSHPGALVAASLALVRDAVDEIVVAADERVAEADLRAYASVADSVVRFPFTGANRFRPWLATRARGDWLLLLDGDEVVSPALLEALERAVRARLCAGYRIPRRWLFPDPSAYVAEEPWLPDLQLRLVRNDDRLRFPGSKHTGAETSGPVGELAGCLYHLELLRPVDERRRKVERARDESFGLLLPDGGEIDERYYLPEDWEPQLAPVPPADRRTIERVLRGARRARRRPRAPVEAVEAAEVERFHPDALRAGVGQAATFEPQARLVRAPAGTLARLPIVVTNTGSGPLPPVPVAPGTFGVSYRLLGPDGAATCQARRTPLLRTLEPGESAELTVEIEAPLACGRHSVELGLVHEGYRWLAIEGEAELEVGPPPSQLFRQEHPGGFVSLVATRADRRRWSVPDALVREDDPASAAARAIAIARETGATRLLCVGAGPVGRALATELPPSAATVVLDEMEEPALAARILEHAPDLAVVGRPAAGCEAQRLSLVPSLRDRLEAPLRLLALGALRDLALIVAERWAALPDVEVGGIWLDGDGILDVGIAPRRDGAARP